MNVLRTSVFFPPAFCNDTPNAFPIFIPFYFLYVLKDSDNFYLDEISSNQIDHASAKLPPPASTFRQWELKKAPGYNAILSLTPEVDTYGT